MKTKQELKVELLRILSDKKYKTADLFQAINTYNLRFATFRKYLGSIPRAKVIESACEVFEIKEPEILFTKSRKRDSVVAKQFMYKYFWEFSNERLSVIGQRFNRDHSNVIYGKQRINDLLEINDPDTTAKWNEFITLVQTK